MYQDLGQTTYCLRCFGCQMNKHDSERVVGMLDEHGATKVDSIEEADIVIFLTCCVREAADQRLRGQVASLKNIPLREDSPLSRRIIAIGGCIGQRDGAALVEDSPHVSVVFGTHNLGSLPALLMSALQDTRPQVEVLASSDSFSTDLPAVRERPWSAWLPITVGCNNFCSYCIVPYVRGRERSRPLESIVEEARFLVADGVKEISLLGQNVNSYGRDLYGSPRFAQLLDQVHDTGVRYLRFATSHPKDLSDELIERFARLEHIAPALHLPVQSGSARILKAMNRRYDPDSYRELIAKIRRARPDIALSTDVIVGFPGETEKDFEDSYRLIDEIGYHQVFTFIYSPRKGTPAAKLSDDTPHELIQERFNRLVALVQAKAYEANQAEQGRVVEALIEGKNRRDPHSVTGRTPKNQTIHAPLPAGISPGELMGSVVSLKVERARTWYLQGSFIDE